MAEEPERKLVRVALAAVAAGLLAALLGAVLAAARPQPLAGIYHGAASGTGRHNRGAGCFLQKPTVFGKRVKPASDHGTRCRHQIIAPSLGPVMGARKGCNPKPAVLDTGGFPIQKARFHYKGRARIGRHGRALTVDFRGRWVTRTKVVGTTRISGAGCSSTASWTMTTPSPGS
jgi:hypothetical protein